jgi:hypothetical protein
MVSCCCTELTLTLLRLAQLDYVYQETYLKPLCVGSGARYRSAAREPQSDQMVGLKCCMGSSARLVSGL